MRERALPLGMLCQDRPLSRETPELRAMGPGALRVFARAIAAFSVALFLDESKSVVIGEIIRVAAGGAIDRQV